MHSLVNRFNATLSIFGMALSLTAFVLSYLSYSTLQSVPSNYFDNTVKFEVTDFKLASKRLRSLGGSVNKPKENAKFKFDLSLNLSPLVDSNTKQIFAYIYVDLDEQSESQQLTGDQLFGADNEAGVVSKIGTRILGGGFPNVNSESKMVIWDHIFEGNNPTLALKGAKSKYSIWDYSPELNGRTGQFKLAYNIQPWIGPLLFGEIDLNESVTLL